MKTLLILILLIVLAGGAFLSRPSEASFREYIHNEMQKRSDDLIGGVLSGMAADRYLDQVQFRDRYLWTTIRRENKVEYVGLFSRWFRWADGELTISAATR